MEKYIELTSKLIEALENSSLSHLELSCEDFRIFLDKSPIEVVDNSITNNSNIKKNKEINKIKTEKTQNNKNIEIFKSPLVGIFYRAKDSDSDAFAKVGDTLKKGDTLCIIEAMKMMNELKAPYDCKIVECLVENEDFVEYNEAIFKLEKVC